MTRSPKAKNKNKYRKKQKSSSKLDFIKNPPKAWTGFLVRNILIGLIVFFCFSSLYNNNKFAGYKWMHEKLIVGNYELMHKYPDHTFEQRQQLKLGFFAKYLQFINKNTPDTAIVLMPSGAVVSKIDKKRKLDWLGSKRHVGYFIYPRKAVYESNSNDSIYMDKVTHVAIVDGKGYENLPYRVKNKSAYTVLPIKLEQKK